VVPAFAACPGGAVPGFLAWPGGVPVMACPGATREAFPAAPWGPPADRLAPWAAAAACPCVAPCPCEGRVLGRCPARLNAGAGVSRPAGAACNGRGTA